MLSCGSKCWDILQKSEVLIEPMTAFAMFHLVHFSGFFVEHDVVLWLYMLLSYEALFWDDLQVSVKH